MERITQLEATLPPHSKDLCTFLWSQFHGIQATKSEEEIIFTARLVAGFFLTPEGKTFALEALGAKIEDANYLHTYYQKDLQGDPAGLIHPKELKKFSGWIYQGAHGLHADTIVEEDHEQTTTCDSCGGLFPSFYCTRVVDVESSGKRDTETQCNHCRQHSADTAIKGTAMHNGCRDCRKIKCHNHVNFKPTHVNDLKKSPFRPHLALTKGM